MTQRMVRCWEMGRKGKMVGLNVACRRYKKRSKKCSVCDERFNCEALTARKPRPVGTRLSNRDGRHGRSAPQTQMRA